ncbi:hypothetical protein MSAS_02600 [Mycobacterium saskatchewanense]|nr:hypothetical protein MSAS_02600 [Mycobacterium saskatchewanense]
MSSGKSTRGNVVIDPSPQQLMEILEAPRPASVQNGRNSTWQRRPNRRGTGDEVHAGKSRPGCNLGAEARPGVSYETMWTDRCSCQCYMNPHAALAISQCIKRGPCFAGRAAPFHPIF